MKPTDAYKHCLLCGSTLINKQTHLECSKCGYQHYLNPAVCNGVIIENEQGEILLVKRKFDPQKGLWDVPGGFIEPYENLEQSVKREIKEELDVDVQMLDIIGVYDDVYLFQDVEIPTLGISVSAKIINGTLKASDDISGFKFFSKDEVLKQTLAFETVRKGLEDYLKKR